MKFLLIVALFMAELSLSAQAAVNCDAFVPNEKMMNSTDYSKRPAVFSSSDRASLAASCLLFFSPNQARKAINNLTTNSHSGVTKSVFDWFVSAITLLAKTATPTALVACNYNVDLMTYQMENKERLKFINDSFVCQSPISCLAFMGKPAEYNTPAECVGLELIRKQTLAASEVMEIILSAGGHHPIDITQLDNLENAFATSGDFAIAIPGRR